jgi:hypothetical protein
MLVSLIMVSSGARKLSLNSSLLIFLNSAIINTSVIRTRRGISGVAPTEIVASIFGTILPEEPSCSSSSSRILISEYPKVLLSFVHCEL